MINGGAAILGLALAAGAAGLLNLIFGFGMLSAMVIVFIALVLAFGYISFRSRFKTIRDFPNKGDFNWHWAAWRFRHYDRFLDPRVRYARHAQAIDETRAAFARVGWGRKEDMDETPDDWLVQKWFAGNHSDIGGSYPETESRLSDIALQWMVEQATEIPHPIRIDRSKLNLFPDAGGTRHCEVLGLLEMYPRWFPRRWRRTWAEETRFPGLTCEACHPTVRERLELPGIHKQGIRQPYRPEPLRGDPALTALYELEDAR